MADEPAADLTLLTALVRQVISEQAIARDDIRVLTAITMRMDTTMAAMLTEMRAMQSQHSRMDHRLRSLEASANPAR